MKSFLLVVCIGLALATPFESEIEAGKEIIFSNESPALIPESEPVDFSKLTIEELLEESVHHPGMEFLNDPEAAASMGIDAMNIDPDLIVDAFSSTCQLVQRRGYNCDIHHVETSNGYILEMHRISGGPVSAPSKGKRVAYLQHGLLDSSATWVVMGVRSGLGYILSDLGYDVWLGNVRGNRYSREHITHDPDGRRGNRRRFWDFSWHQMGTIDLPTMIDYITHVTGQHIMHYVGHSQGTTSFLIMCSERREYNARIISAHMLAPIAFMGRLFSPFVRAAALFQNTIDFGAGLLGIYEFLPNSEIMSLLGQAACRDQAWFQSMCSNVLFLIGGFNSVQMNSTMLPVLMGHTPAGASVDQVVHYAQGIRSGRFRQYDHGEQFNAFTTDEQLIHFFFALQVPFQICSHMEASVLLDIIWQILLAPTALYFSQNDWLSDPRDVRELYNGMTGRRQMLIEVADSRFNHFDYCWAIDVKTLVYDKVVQIMKEHEN